MNNARLDVDDLVNLAVPRRHYALVLRTLAGAIDAEDDLAGVGSVAVLESWTADDVRHLRRLVDNKTVIALMELVCATPGKKVLFRSVCEKAGRTHAQARADLAGLTKLIRQRFNREEWPINVVQNSDGGLTYDINPAIADAWQGAL